MPSPEERRRQQQLDFLARLRKALKASGLNQKELAKRLGLAESSVTGWLKHNAMPGADVLFELPYVLGVSADWLLAGRGDRQPAAGVGGVEAGQAEGALTALDEVALALRDLRHRWQEKQQEAHREGTQKARQSAARAAKHQHEALRQKKTGA